MPLPDGGKQPWPPESVKPALRAIGEWAAWYSGDPAQLTKVYGGLGSGFSISDGQPTAPWWKFWARTGRNGSTTRQRAQLHVPLAGDIASTSAALLFGEPPTIQIPEAHGSTVSPEAKATEDRLHTLIEDSGFLGQLVEAADLAAGLGGVFLKPDWDSDVLDHPVLSTVQPDQAMPEFRFRTLRAVTLWRTVRDDDREVIRHIERHEVGANGRGVILHGLYRGTSDMLGERLSDVELAAMLKLQPLVELPFDGIGIRYVPNMRPNRRLRGSELGQADYAGAEGLLDALDEAWGSWMRDIRLGKARILVPESFLDSNGRFDMDHEVFTKLEIPPSAGADKGIAAQIQPQQFEIRVDEHARTTLGLIERIVDHAGYAPQTFGLNVDATGELSGTALTIRERKSFLTQQRKAGWWGPVVADLAEMFLAIDREIFKRPTQVARPRVELSDSIARDDRQIAETVELWARAKSASTEIKVRTIHPEWEREEVELEVQRILAEEGLAVTPPEQPAA